MGVVDVPVGSVLILKRGKRGVNRRCAESNLVKRGASDTAIDAVLAFIEIVVQAHKPLCAVTRKSFGEAAIERQGHVAG